MRVPSIQWYRENGSGCGWSLRACLWHGGFKCALLLAGTGAGTSSPFKMHLVFNFPVSVTKKHFFFPQNVIFQ